jgi:hypothetical protein
MKKIPYERVLHVLSEVSPLEKWLITTPWDGYNSESYAKLEATLRYDGFVARVLHREGGFKIQFVLEAESLPELYALASGKLNEALWRVQYLKTNLDDKHLETKLFPNLESDPLMEEINNLYGHEHGLGYLYWNLEHFKEYRKIDLTKLARFLYDFAKDSNYNPEYIGIRESELDKIMSVSTSHGGTKSSINVHIEDFFKKEAL